MSKLDSDFSGQPDGGSGRDTSRGLSKPSAEQLELIKSGVHVRDNKYPPYNGTSYYREQYVQADNMFFSVEGKLHRPTKIYRAVYMLIPVWGFSHEFPARVIGYKIQENGNRQVGPMEDFACLNNEHLTVKFSDDPSNL